jgi:adenylate kinase family enzyme
MSGKSNTKKYVVFSPNLRADDDAANFWMRQATVRLRREICWLWHERGLDAPNTQQLPPFTDKLSVSLDLTRYWTEKQEFLKTETTAAYLTEQLSSNPPKPKKSRRGSFAWLIEELQLSDVACFTLGLALTTALDANMGSVIAACLNDGQKTYPNLMLIQRLWDTPEEVLSLADPLHKLFAFGLLRHPNLATRFYPETFWEQPLTVPSMISRQLLFDENVKPEGVVELESKKDELTAVERIVAHRLKEEKAAKLRVVPLQAPKGANLGETVAAMSNVTKRTVWEFDGNPSLLANEDYFNALATLCFLQDRDLFINTEIFGHTEKHSVRNENLPLVSIPATLFLPISERRQIEHIDADLLLPIIKIQPLGYAERVKIWKSELGAKAKAHERTIAEIARRFRYEKEAISEICRELNALPGKLTEMDFTEACRAEMNLDIGELAQEIVPRFHDEKLILPNKQFLQFEEQLTAMRNLTAVHYVWGTAAAWNESGITVLFAGPPGTGKTMAAEILAFKLDLPMYRIDLSQIVNKYIGETEKNLKKVFDAADVSDVVLFFDEADSLFGKRTEVSDSRDRYANLEVSYLLERMERFKGLAILATNRKRDLDEAFMRRLRYIIDFPLPEEAQRKQIWQQVIPKKANSDELDFDFLARQFPMSGGNIRSVVFNACLQSAGNDNETKSLKMRDVLIAVKREYDKMNRAISLEQFGFYAKDIDGLE